MKPMDLEGEELTMYIKDIYEDEVEPITRIFPYIPLRKSTTKVPKDSDSTKFMVCTQLLPENVLFEDNLLAQIPYLKMEEWNLGDNKKFP